jgi:MtN3 and saliva related transmembrane protein
VPRLRPAIDAEIVRSNSAASKIHCIAPRIRSEPDAAPRITQDMISLTTLIGLLAAFCTTASYIPQLKKCWDSGSTEDISLKMFLILAAGVALWVVYGVLQRDLVIVLANSVSLLLLGGILFFKLREMFSGARGPGDSVPTSDAR